MRRCWFKQFTIRALVTRALVVTSLCMLSVDADARGWSTGSWGSSGSSGSSGSWGASSSSGSSGSWGGRVRYRYYQRHLHRHHSSGSWGSSSSSGSWGGSSGSWGGSSGSSAGWGGSGSHDPPRHDAPEAPHSGETTASFTVRVPEDAKVYVNDKLTTSTGIDRRYMSQGLKTGENYTFHVRVELSRDGQALAETRTIKLIAGSQRQLVFDFPGKSEAPQVAGNQDATKLTLHVPASAKVVLAGRETSTPGEVREFVTTQLSPGVEWENYIIRVSVQRGGQTLSKERAITLVGGEAQELSFLFDEDRLAIADR